MKKEKGSVKEAIKILWKVMTPFQKFCCIPMFFALMARPFAILMPVQSLSAVIAKLEGSTAFIFGVALPESWSVEIVAIFSFSLLLLLWLIGVSAYFMVWMASGKITNQVNNQALKWALSPRKNMDIQMTKGEFCYLVKSSTDTIQNFLETILINVFPPLVSFVISIISIGFIDWIVMLMIIGVSILITICAYLRTIFDRKPLINEEFYRGKINNLFLNSITNLPFISLFKSFANEKSRLSHYNEKYYDNVKKKSKIGWIYWIFVLTFECSSMACAVIIANSHASTGSISISAAVLLLGYITNIYDPIEQLGYNISTIQQCAIKISRLNLIKPNSEKMIKTISNRPTINKINKIQMQDICLSLGTFKMENINLTFNKGQMIALTGPSGCGKTSIIQALLGLREHTKGKIIVNDMHEVQSLFFDDDKISYALQEMQLFDKSLNDNLLYPNLEINTASEKIIKTLGVDKILERNVGKEEGFERTLSGGEKKRINLARTFIKSADLYILDEPTNELDKKNVEKVLKILQQLKKKSIVIVISHDARLTEICDKVIYF